MQKQFSISEAKNRLPTIIHYVEKWPYVELIRRGKPVAVLLPIQEYERLSRKYTWFWSAVSEFRRKVKDEMRNKIMGVPLYPLYQQADEFRSSHQ